VGQPRGFTLKGQLRKFTAILEDAEEGGYVVKCLEVPVTTEGETRADALKNIREAVEGYLQVRAELLGKPRSKKKQLVEIAVRQTSKPVMA
jgi:predicted RNase H-like HicB family nuclease